MRMMLKFTLGLEAANEIIKSGKMDKVMGMVMERVKPEAAYFTAFNGERTGFLFFDMKDNSEIPYIAEPLFLELKAKVEFLPAMNAQELKAGLEKAMKG